MFLQMDEAKTKARTAGMDIIDLSIGTPDILPPREALDALKVRIAPVPRVIAVQLHGCPTWLACIANHDAVTPSHLSAQL